MVKTTKPGLDSVLVSQLVKDFEFENVIAVWVSVLALKITHAHFAQVVVPCTNATAVFGNEGPVFTFD